MMLHLIAQDSTGRNVVAITEPTGHAQHLVVRNFARFFQQPVNMPPLWLAASQRKSVPGFRIAIRTRRPQY
jgi:hypothetical protein